MKAHWNKAVSRIDGLTLRERVIIFFMAALGLVMAVNKLMLEPQVEEQKRIAQRISDERNQISRIRAEIQQKVSEHVIDPDVANRERLIVLKGQSANLRASIGQLQKSLVSPDKMATLLEDMLRSNTQLKLLSLKKLPVTSIVEMSSEPSATGQALAPVGGLFKHAIELTVQGSYLDMQAYLAQLERMHAQLVWGDLVFAVDQHPDATMTLTVLTLSLDKQWLHI